MYGVSFIDHDNAIGISCFNQAHFRLYATLIQNITYLFYLILYDKPVSVHIFISFCTCFINLYMYLSWLIIFNCPRADRVNDLKLLQFQYS